MGQRYFLSLIAAGFLALTQAASAQFYSGDGRDVLEELSTVARVKVGADGGVTFDEKSVTPAELEQALNRLKQINGAILYYREKPKGIAPEKQMAPFRAILAAGLPVSLSTQPDFSDYVDPEGNVHKRPLSW